MRDIFPINEDTYKLFEPYGITQEDFLRMPAEDHLRLMRGEMTSLMTLKMKNGEGEDTVQRARLGLVQGENGVELRVYPQTDRIEKGELKLSKRDLQKLEEEGFVYAEMRIRGKRNRYFVQVDRETNSLLYAKADDISQNIPMDIVGATLTKEQRDTIRDGQPVTFEANGKKYSIWIDLQFEGGIRLKQL